MKIIYLTNCINDNSIERTAILSCYNVNDNEFEDIDNDMYNDLIDKGIVFTIIDDDKEINDRNKGVAFIFCLQKLRYIDYFTYINVVNYIYGDKDSNDIEDFEIVFDKINGNNLKFKDYIKIIDSTSLADIGLADLE